MPFYSEIFKNPQLTVYKQNVIDNTLVVGALIAIGIYSSAIFGGEVRPLAFKLVDLAIVIPVIILAIFRKKVSLQIKVLAILMILLVLSFKDLMILGIYADTTVLLALVPFFSTLVFRFKLVILISMVTLLCFIVVVALQLNGYMSPMVIEPVVNASEWIEKGLVILITASIVFISSVYFERGSLLFIKGLLEEKKISSARESNLSSIIESTNNIIGLFDTNKTLIEFNQSFAQYAYYTDGIVLEKGMDVFSKMQKTQAALFNEYQDRALAGEKFTETIEYPSPEGPIYFMLSYNPIYQEGKITGLSMFVQDISELKIAQQKLESYNLNLEQRVASRTALLEKKNEELAEKNESLDNALNELQLAQDQLIKSEKMASLGVLAAGLGHEINNPLNYISNGVREIENAALKSTDSSFLEFSNPLFEIVKEGVDRASNIVASLSQYSRQTDNINERCDLKKIIENCLTILHLSDKGQRNLTVELSEVGLIQGNAGKLHQLFTNILTNSLDATIKGGKISVFLRKLNHEIQVEIIDNGAGISRENFHKITDPFFTTKPVGQGTGLGLYISHQIVEEHRGKIFFDTFENNGTSVTIIFPSLREAPIG
ncbi:MAG: ATP-binding protein [Cyclobacteriaceae bacterium]